MYVYIINLYASTKLIVSLEPFKERITHVMKCLYTYKLLSFMIKYLFIYECTYAIKTDKCCYIITRFKIQDVTVLIYSVNNTLLISNTIA